MIQPIDIKTQKFKKGLFGYKSSEVNDFINAVYMAYDELFKENAELSENLERVNSSLQENRLKLFDLENKVQELENASGGDDLVAKKKADDIIKNAEAAAASIIAKAKEQSEKLEQSGTTSTKAEPKVEVKPETKTEAPKETASSRFFKKSADEAPASNTDDDDDEIFVGEIEDKRKPDRMMIGDGEEEGSDDFEFL